MLRDEGAPSSACAALRMLLTRDRTHYASREEAERRAAAQQLAQQAEAAARPLPPAGEPPLAPPIPGAPHASAAAPVVGMGLLRRPVAKKAPVAGGALFAELEEAPRARTLIPLQYTEEELRSALVNEYEIAPEAPLEAATGAEADAARGGRRDDKDARRRREREEKDARKGLMELIEAIPTERSALFAYPVDWAVFDASGLRDTVQRWVAKKVSDLLGEAEPSLVEFITAQTAAHAQPEALLGELDAVLDDEAEAFVIKLYRMVIFETLRKKTAV